MEGLPQKGGNRAELLKILNGARAVSTVESCMYNYQSTSGEAFIALQLLIDWEELSMSHLLREECEYCGISKLGHPQHITSIQCLYIDVA